MKLIGMLDSPYVRRVAIAARQLDLPFAHDPLSVFSTFAEFGRINPVVKAPTLVCDDGTVLMDSNLIIDHLETLAGRSLWPAGARERLRALRVTGLALAACEKAVQIVYELNLRPSERQHGPWLDRVGMQLDAALGALDAELAQEPAATEQRSQGNADITAAIAWSFIRLKLGDRAQPVDYPALSAHAAALESLPVFVAIPADEMVDASTTCRAD